MKKKQAVDDEPAMTLASEVVADPSYVAYPRWVYKRDADGQVLHAFIVESKEQHDTLTEQGYGD